MSLADAWQAHMYPALKRPLLPVLERVLRKGHWYGYVFSKLIHLNTLVLFCFVLVVILITYSPLYVCMCVM